MIIKIKKQKGSISSKHNRDGFTIIELIISSALFVVLISLATGAFLQTLRTQKIVTDLSASMNDVSFVTEQISREVRTGFSFNSSGNVLNFRNAKGDAVSYSLVSKSIQRCENGPCRTLTSSGVNIDRLTFILQGAGTDGEPPRVTILMSVLGEQDIRINLQTTISSRILDK